MGIIFDVKEDEKNNILFLTNAEGNDILHTPLLNKGTAFDEEEREKFGLDGLIPPKILKIEQQVEKIYYRYSMLAGMSSLCEKCRKISKKEKKEIKREINLSRFNFLRDLQDRNEILFYAFCYKYLEEVLPIIYTPTVGDAVVRYSLESARFRGIFISPKNIDSIDSVFDHFRFKHPKIAVVTDNQGILGLGDQGIGGIDIPIGKLSLYVLGAGIRPWETMPITLDVGTNNISYLKDPYYLGYKKGRLIGKNYEEFINKFVEGIKRRYPDILLQWEDFSRENAFFVLEKYRYKVLSFNDDIQGTGAVALAGIINALKISKEELKDQRFVIYGAGAGGIGIARQIVNCLRQKYKLSKGKAYDKIVVLDSRGMITEEREVSKYKKSFSKNREFYRSWKLEDSSFITLLDVVRNFEPTVLIGVSGCGSHFTPVILKEMAKNTKRPIIFPLSNPASNSEATPHQIYKYTNGRAIVATGSPFEPFKYNGKTIKVGQGNNFLIFPGIGLGAILSKEPSYIDDNVFTEAAYTLARITSDKLIKKGIVYPLANDIRNVSAEIAFATIKEMSKERTLELSLDYIKSKMWIPHYPKLVKL